MNRVNFCPFFCPFCGETNIELYYADSAGNAEFVCTDCRLKFGLREPAHVTAEEAKVPA